MGKFYQIIQFIQIPSQLLLILKKLFNKPHFTLFRVVRIMLAVLLIVWGAGAAGAKMKNSSLNWDQISQEYKSGNFEGLHSRLQNMENWNPKVKNYDEALVILIDSELRLGNYEYAGKLVNYFNIAIRNSELLPRVLYYEGLLSEHKENYFDAALKFTQAVNTTGSRSLFPGLNPAYSK